MNKMLKVILPVMLIPLLLIAGCSGQPAPDISGMGLITACDEYTGQGLQAGDPAPDFQFQNAGGQAISLSDFRGKPVMLNFWATWCGYCKIEMPYIQQVYDEWQEKGLVLLAIDLVEDADVVAEFIQEQGIPFPVLLDREGKVTIQYFKGMDASIPRTFFIDKNGILQYIQTGAFSSKEEIESILSQLD
jgi:peroxiredoxin